VSELTHGRKVFSIVANDGQKWIDTSHKSVESMEIVIEDSHMAGVPWVKETRTDGSIHLHNCATLESISLAEGTQTMSETLKVDGVIYDATSIRNDRKRISALLAAQERIANLCRYTGVFEQRIQEVLAEEDDK